MSANVVRMTARGAGAIDEEMNPGGNERWKLTAVTLNLADVPTVSENFTITLSFVQGGIYETLLLSHDLSSTDTTDLVYLPDGEVWLEPGDAVLVAYPNSAGDDWGLTLTFNPYEEDERR